MKRRTILSLSVSLLLVSLPIFSCSDTESRVPSYLKTAKVIINLGLPEAHATASQSIIDRVLRFFTSDAVAQEAPATFSSIFVRVTGPDMGPIEKTFSAGASISFEVPAGALRQFEVIAYVAPGDPGAAASFRGTGTATLPAGSTVSVLVLMGLYETRLVIPDYANNIILQLNDFGDTDIAGWKVADLDSTLYPANLSPYDIDFDSLGRIYVAPYNWNSHFIRLNNIFSSYTNGSLIESFYIGTEAAYTAIAVDRARNLVYCSTEDALYRSDLNGSESSIYQIDTSSYQIWQIYGIDVEPASGDLFLACYYFEGPPEGPAVVRLSIPGTVTVDTLDSNFEGAQFLDPESTARDVMVKGSHVYVAHTTYPGGDYNGITQFDLDLTQTYDRAPRLEENPDSATDYFYGPRRFVATLNKRFCVMDENMTSDRLVGFIDITGAGWQTFEPGSFRFYDC